MTSSCVTKIVRRLEAESQGLINCPTVPSLSGVPSTLAVKFQSDSIILIFNLAALNPYLEITSVRTVCWRTWFIWTHQRVSCLLTSLSILCTDMFHSHGFLNKFLFRIYVANARMEYIFIWYRSVIETMNVFFNVCMPIFHRRAPVVQPISMYVMN